jgi:hypothetical protein
VPPQNLVNRTIVDVSALGVKLAYPDGRRAAHDTQPERNAGSRTTSGVTVSGAAPRGAEAVAALDWRNSSRRQRN